MIMLKGRTMSAEFDVVHMYYRVVFRVAGSRGRIKLRQADAMRSDDSELSTDSSKPCSLRMLGAISLGTVI